MTIEACATAARDAMQGKSDAWPRILRECAEKGYYTIPAGLAEGSGCGVAVTVHGYPDPRENDTRRMHRHEFFELIYVYHGAYLNRMEEGEVLMEAGDLMLLNTNVLHSPCLFRREDIAFNILISRRLVQDRLIPQLASNELLFPFFYHCIHSGAAIKQFILFKAAPRESKTLAEQLILEALGKPRYYREALPSLLHLLLLSLSRSGHLSGGQAPPDDGERFFELQLHEYILQHLCTATLPDAARSLTYSPAYLSRKVRQALGITFSQLLTDYRVRRACTLLLDTAMSQEEIARAVGYVDASHFIRKFKENLHVTPGEYRKNAGK